MSHPNVKTFGDTEIFRNSEYEMQNASVDGVPDADKICEVGEKASSHLPRGEHDVLL